MDGTLSWPALSYVRDTSYGGCKRQMELDGCMVLLVAYRLASGMPASSGLVKGHPHYCCNLHSLVVCESIMLLEIA